MSSLALDRWLLVMVVFGLSLTPWAFAQNISNDQLQLVVARLADGATHSWELGTRAQALLELNSALYSVFSNASLPPPTSPPSSSSLPDNLTDVLSIARDTVSLLSNDTPTQPLVAKDGAAGDPASIGIAVILANWTNAPPPVAPAPNATAVNGTATNTTSVTNSTTLLESFKVVAPTNVTAPNYAEAAASQLEYLLTSVPRTSDGAISHRVSQVQLWSDFVYMAPPFLAYYGVITQNQSLITESYNQIKLYRSYLRDSSAMNIWRHITLGTGTDYGHWSTGNGWAASGILRVLATIKHSSFANQFQSEQTDLKNWAAEILNGMYSFSTDSHIFHNYADDTSTFNDCSSTAMVAAATYRLAVLTQTYNNLPNAEKSRKALSDGTHLDANGWLTPVVNPEDPSSSGAQSPEGQAFVVEMQAAWKDWVAMGSPGANAAQRLTFGGGATWFTMFIGVVLVLFLI